MSHVNDGSRDTNLFEIARDDELLDVLAARLFDTDESNADTNIDARPYESDDVTHMLAAWAQDIDDEAEAIMIANGVDLGVTGSVWTNDVTRAHRVALALEAGYTWINGSSSHFPNVPYGGVKGSGVGGKEECLEELLSYTEAKVINVML